MDALIVSKTPGRVHHCDEFVSIDKICVQLCLRDTSIHSLCHWCLLFNNIVLYVWIVRLDIDTREEEVVLFVIVPNLDYLFGNFSI